MGEENKKNNLARRVNGAVRATVPLIITAIACASDGKEQLSQPINQQIQPSITPKIEQSIFQEGKIREEIKEKFDVIIVQPKFPVELISPQIPYEGVPLKLVVALTAGRTDPPFYKIVLWKEEQLLVLRNTLSIFPLDAYFNKSGRKPMVALAENLSAFQGAEGQCYCGTREESAPVILLPVEKGLSPDRIIHELTHLIVALKNEYGTNIDGSRKVTNSITDETLKLIGIDPNDNNRQERLQQRFVNIKHGVIDNGKYNWLTPLGYAGKEIEELVPVLAEIYFKGKERFIEEVASLATGINQAERNEQTRKLYDYLKETVFSDAEY